MSGGSTRTLVVFALVIATGLATVAVPAAATPIDTATGEDPVGDTLDSDTSGTDSSSTDSSSDTSSTDSSSTDSTSTDSSTSDSTDLSEDTETVDGTTDTLEGTGEDLLDGTPLLASRLDPRDALRYDSVENPEFDDLDDETDALDTDSLSVTGVGAVESLASNTLDGTDLGLLSLSTTGVASPGSTSVVLSVSTEGATSTLGLAGGGASGVPAAGPPGGVAVGVGAVVAATAARKWASMPTVLAGLAGTLASLAPAAPRSARLSRLVRTIAPFRYSRYDDSDPLEHDARESVYDLVQQRPGAYLSEVSEGADLPLSTARHHVRVLEQEDLVTAAKVRGKRRFYPAYTSGVEVDAALNDDATAAILDAIARLGAASVSDLAEAVEKDPSTISHHLQRLETDDLIVREREGRAVMNRLSPVARTALHPEREPHESPVGPVTVSGAD